MKLAASDAESVAPLARGMGRLTFHAEVRHANTSRHGKEHRARIRQGQEGGQYRRPGNDDACDVQLCCSRQRLPHHIVWL